MRSKLIQYPGCCSRILNRITLLLTALLIAVGSPAVSGQDIRSQEKLIISGASGKLGGLAVEELLRRGVDPHNLILVSRTPEKLARYAEMGASVRFGDFMKPESL